MVGGSRILPKLERLLFVVDDSNFFSFWFQLESKVKLYLHSNLLFVFVLQNGGIIHQGLSRTPTYRSPLFGANS